MIAIVRSSITALALTLGGCFGVDWSSSPPPSLPAKRLDSLELFVARRDLSKVSFEHYKIDRRNLFTECGEIRRGKMASQDQTIRQLAPSELQRLSADATLLQYWVETKRFEFNAPGQHSSMADPGELRLHARLDGSLLAVTTSLDSIAPPSGSALEALAEMTKDLRGLAGKDLCATPDFFGVGRN